MVPGCRGVAGCCRVLPGCRVGGRTSSQAIYTAGLPGCRVPGVAGCCRVAGWLPGGCRVRLPGCRGQGSKFEEAKRESDGSSPRSDSDSDSDSNSDEQLTLHKMMERAALSKASGPC